MVTPETISQMETRENKFQSSKKLCEYKKKLYYQFHFISTFKCFMGISRFVFDLYCCLKRFLFCLQQDDSNLLSFFFH